MRKLVFALLCFFLVLNVINIILVYSINSFLFGPESSTNSTGIVGFTIVSLEPEVFIHSPENLTYNFNYTQYNNYSLDLNVSSNFGANSWYYVLEDLKHEKSYPSIGFALGNEAPSVIMESVRWSNRLTVFGENNNTEVQANASVVFFVNVSNHAPTLDNLSDIFVCEGDTFDTRTFNATDIDEDGLVLWIIDPQARFFSVPYDPLHPNMLIYPGVIGQAGYSIGWNAFFIDAPNGTLAREHIGSYVIDMFAQDFGIPQYVDKKNFTIDIIDINNPPVLSIFGINQSAATVWAYGAENRTFYEEVSVYDIDCQCNQTSGNFSYNLTFLDGVLPFFNISRFGIINFTANESFLGPNNSSVVYNISLCVTDNALRNIHPNISVCNQTGLNQTTCQLFYLTVTAKNRPPHIDSYYPSNLTFSKSGTQEIYFNLTDSDPDGTIPDTYWYVDNSFIEYDNNSKFDEFRYTFACGVRGLHFVKVVVSDGEMNDSVQWNITVESVGCPVSQPSGGGGGGGGGGGSPLCESRWICGEWDQCSLLSRGLQGKQIISEDYRFVKTSCEKGSLGDEVCGFQRRACIDILGCNLTKSQPPVLSSCYYTENPDCFDGIKNCHDGKCEFLVDCGGPCSTCPTCSDGIQNQGEEKIDCGGPCPNSCPVEIPEGTKFLNYLLYTISVILVVIVIVLVYRLRKKRDRKIQ